MLKTEVNHIITIGASAGGLEAVSELLRTFSIQMDAAIFIVIHLSEYSRTDLIVKTLQRNCALKCAIAIDEQDIENGTIYFAPTDHHILIEKGKIRITKGATENHWRPSIDVLFRSAAAAYNSCVVGIILTGMLDDGTSGMNAIKRCGGTCIVQDPDEAAFPGMPNSVLRNVPVDYQARIEEMAQLLSIVLSNSVCQSHPVPADIQLEVDIAKRLTSNLDDLVELGQLSPFTCPDCGGDMVKIEGDASPRYRCYTGHTFTEKFLEDRQLRKIEEALWVSIRMMEERKNLLINMVNEAAANRLIISKTDERIKDIQSHIETLRATLLNISLNDRVNTD